MRENWGRQGMPPTYYDVKNRVVTFESETIRGETVWITGEHPHLGKSIEGWSGRETVVFREVLKGPRPRFRTRNEH